MKITMKNGKGGIQINGRSYVGGNVIIRHGVVTIDGVVQEDEELTGVINVTVNGDVESLENEQGNVTVSGNVDKINTQTGDVRCGDVQGNINTQTGDVKCGKVGGSINSMTGDIRHG